MTMQRPVFSVDFNEMVDFDLVLLSAEDSKVDASGATIQLREGMMISIYMDDFDDAGNADNLVATGVVEKNSKSGWANHVRWCCRIDRDGVLPQSEIS